ncbi:MAG: hypothetical protein SVY53_05160 [Chloroflexota bacterium]|nr:hypothetical protein [Chloroflexota bacterium]
MKEIKYLDKVRITHKLVRTADFYDLYWSRVEYSRSGVCLGNRTLSDGEMVLVDYNPIDGSNKSYEYRAKEYHKVYLVSPGPNVNPVYVMKEDISKEDDNERRVGW